MCCRKSVNRTSNFPQINQPHMKGFPPHGLRFHHTALWSSGALALIMAAAAVKAKLQRERDHALVYRLPDSAAVHLVVTRQREQQRTKWRCALQNMYVI